MRYVKRISSLLVIIQVIMYPIQIAAQNSGSDNLNEVKYPTRVSTLNLCGVSTIQLSDLDDNNDGGIGRDMPMDETTYEGLSFDRKPGGPKRMSPSVNGAVGKQFYVQLISDTDDAGIFNKTDGRLVGRLNLDILFCIMNSSENNVHKPVILYDEHAEMFVALSRIENTGMGQNDKDYLAFSKIEIADGEIRITRWQLPAEICDEAKMGIQQDGYYISINRGNNRNVDDVFVINRNQVINNDSDITFMSFINPARPNTLNGFHFILPIDIDGEWPDSNTPGMFITIADDDQGNPVDEIWLYELTTDWTNLWSSTFKQTRCVFVSSFTNTNGIMIQQGNDSFLLESNSGVLSHRAQFRRIDGEEVITCVQTVTGEGFAAGLRWYQLHRDNYESHWRLKQEGCLQDQDINSNEKIHRYNGSIAMNENGDVFLGYHASSENSPPQIFVRGQTNALRSGFGNGRLDIQKQNVTANSDPGSQAGSSKWGSFTNISCDPDDNYAVWYSNYYIHNASNTLTNEHCKTLITKLSTGSCDLPPPGKIHGFYTVPLHSLSGIIGAIARRGDVKHVMVVGRREDTPIAEPISGVSYRADQYFGRGSTTGPGNYVLHIIDYNDYGPLEYPDKIKIEGLDPGSCYYFDLYVANKTGDTYCYFLPGFSTLGCTGGWPCPYNQPFNDWAESSPGYNCTPNGSVSLIDGWVNNIDGDDIDWDINSGSTKSTNTGPTDDVSLVGKYMYHEASSCYETVGYLTSPAINLNDVESPTLSFFYHMWGSDMGSLSVEYSEDCGNTWLGPIWSRENDQGNQWHKAVIPIINLGYLRDRFRFRFKSVTGGNYNSDIAIDEVSVKTFTSEIPPYLQTFDFWQTSSPRYSCTADGSIELPEQWNNATGDDVDWDVKSGPTLSDGTGPPSGYMGNGNYMYLESSGCYGKTGYLESPVFDLSGSNYPELKFYYHMYCSSITYDGMGSLKLEVSTDYGDTWEPIWFVEGNQGNQWNEVTISLNPYNHIKDFVFRFTGKTGSNYMSDIAIDHVSIDSPCESVFTFPYTMGFDSWTTGNPNSDCTPDGSVTLEECWLNVNGDDIDWDIHSGSTSSSGTGPASGYNGIGNYLYLESSYCWLKKASIKSPIFDFSVSYMRKPTLNFQYHMYGESMGSLQVDISKTGGSTWEDNCIFNIFGDQGDQWNSARINLEEYLNESNIAFRFTGNTGNDFTSDIALDEIEIYDECSRLELPYEEGFESWVNFSCQSSTYCNPNGSIDLLPYCWENSKDDDFDWAVGKDKTPSSNTGPSSGAYGSHRYLYTEVSGGSCYNKQASVQTPDFDMSFIQNQPLLYFNYHMYGEEMGTLSVDVSTDFGRTWSNLWSISGNQGNLWLYQVIPLSNYISKPYVRFRFRAQSGPGYTSDIAIDNIKISNGNRENNSQITAIDEGQDQWPSNYVLSLNVFPNPNNGLFNVVINSQKERQVSMKIVNAMGIIVYQYDNIEIGTGYRSEVNLSAYPKGIYYLVVTSNKNEIINSTIVYN